MRQRNSNILIGEPRTFHVKKMAHVEQLVYTKKDNIKVAIFQEDGDLNVKTFRNLLYKVVYSKGLTKTDIESKVEDVQRSWWLGRWRPSVDR